MHLPKNALANAMVKKAESRLEFYNHWALNYDTSDLIFISGLYAETQKLNNYIAAIKYSEGLNEEKGKH